MRDDGEPDNRWYIGCRITKCSRIKCEPSRLDLAINIITQLDNFIEAGLS